MQPKESECGAATLLALEPTGRQVGEKGYSRRGTLLAASTLRRRRVSQPAPGQATAQDDATES